MKLWLCLLLFVACSSNGATIKTSTTISAEQRAAIAKIRGELNDALEAGEAEQEGVIVQPEWTKQAQKTVMLPSKVIVNPVTIQAAKALRSEIKQAVRKQGHTDAVRQLEKVIKAKTGEVAGSHLVGSVQQEEMLGSSLNEDQDQDQDGTQANVVDAAPLDIDLAQLQQLELSKRRTREMLILSRIEENLQFSFGQDVSNWLQLQQNGTNYFLGQREQELQLLQQQQQLVTDATFHSYESKQILKMQERINHMISYDHWNTKKQQQESLVLISTERELLWFQLETNLNQFWVWPLENVNRLLSFSLENQDYLLVVANQTLSIYAYDVVKLEFWIVQRLQLLERITAIAVLDTGRDLLLAVGQLNEAIIYAHNMHELQPEAGLQLQPSQHLEAPQISDIVAFQMGGRSYLALGGQRPQILVYVQGQLLPKTVLGQNFGLVELFLPVPVRSYRDDLLLLVQHRVYFDTHSLVQLEVLVWNGEAFEASLPAPCELGSQIRYGCLLDELRDKGLAGAALQKQVQPPLLIVPRHEAPAGLFRLHTQLLPRNSELHDIQEIQQFMRNWVEEQDKLLQHAAVLLHATDTEKQLIQQTEINTFLVINEGSFINSLFVNDVPWTSKDASIDLLDLLQQIRVLKQQLLDHNSGRDKRQSQLFHYDYEQLDFDVVEVDQDLILDQLNHVPFFIQNATLQFNGSINVQQLQLLQPPLSNVPLKSLPSSTRQHFELNGNLTCHYINGLDFKVFLADLIWRDEPLKLSQLQVQGAVVFEDSLHLSALNELNFPADFLWSQGSSTSIVRAPKQFTQTLTVNDVDTNGRINGRDPLDAITLSDAQDWPGFVTFTQLEVSEELQLNGNAQGRHFEEAPLNPTLLESHEIQAACHFNQLIVNGELKVNGEFDGDTYETLFGDMVQRSVDGNEELIIPGVKHVEQLILPVDAHVIDNKLSGIPIEQFVTKHTEQIIENINILNGYVYFHQLNLSGSFDGVHLKQLMEQGLRLDAPIIAPTTRLQFVKDIELPQLQVTGYLNDVPLSGYQTLLEPLHLSQARFESLKAEQLDVAYNVTGKGYLNNKLLDELLNMTKETDHVQVQELILPMGVEANKLQGLEANQLLNFLQQLDVLPLLILHGQLQVAQIAVNGAVQVEGSINNRNLEQLQREVVWLDQPNELRTRWRFQQSPIFERNLVLQGSYNQRLLPELLEDIVFRSEEQLLIVGTKNFAGEVTIKDTLQLDALNGVPFKHLANKLEPINLAGNLHLTGKLYADNLQLKGDLNNQPVKQLEEQLIFDPQLQTFVQRGLIELPQQQLQDLTVLGHLGNRSQEPLQEFFSNLLEKSSPHLQVDGHKIFTGRVSIQNGAQLNELNGIQVKKLLEQLILLDGKDVVTIHTPVSFKDSVHMNQLHVDQLILQGERINGCNITEWIHDTIRVDRNWRATAPISFSPGALDNNALKVNQLNHLNLSDVVTLHTEQVFSYPLVAKELHLRDGHVWMQGLVNGLNLSEEYYNTLLVSAPSGIQRVETPLVMQSVDVLNSLVANSSINGDRNLNLSDVATLREEQLHLKTPLYFEMLHAPELRTQYLINGFDYNAWHEKSLWSQGRNRQLITGNWSVYWLRVKQPHEAEEEAHLIYRRQTMELEERHKELCRRLARLFGLLQLPYQVKQLKYSFELQLDENQADLRQVFAVKSPLESINYLLLNELGCWTRIYRWNGTSFVESGAFESGPIDEVTVLHLKQNQTKEQFSFMTSYELNEDEEESQWNCGNLKQLQSWRTQTEMENIQPLNISKRLLKKLQQQHATKQQQQQSVHSYQQAIKYLKMPSMETELSPYLKATHKLNQEQFDSLKERLLTQLNFRLQTEVNITQLSIPESDLYDDEQLVENFLWLMRQLRKSHAEIFVKLPVDTLHLPNNPARVLAARSSYLIWPVREELLALQLKLNNSQLELEQELIRNLEQTVHDVLELAYMGSSLKKPIEAEDEDTIRLHAVIERLRQLQMELETKMELQPQEESKIYKMTLPATHFKDYLQPVQTIRLFVGPSQHSKLLYARLTIVELDAPSIAPSTAPVAHIQLHHANGTLFQSLAADLKARQLTALRVRDETLLSFVEGCCQVRVFIYRGVQGFVPFAQFQTEPDDDILQLLSLRLPLQQQPGAIYTLAVVHTRRIVFYEFEIPGLFESWLKC